MPNEHVGVLFRDFSEMPRQLLYEVYGAVSSSGTADGYREVGAISTLEFADPAFEERYQILIHTIDDGVRLEKADHWLVLARELSQ